MGGPDVPTEEHSRVDRRPYHGLDETAEATIPSACGI